jgi:hypothetical protein
MKDLKIIFRSLLIVAPFVIAIWIIAEIFERKEILQDGFQPLIWIAPILVIFSVWLIIKSKW